MVKCENSKNSFTAEVSWQPFSTQGRNGDKHWELFLIPENRTFPKN